MSITYPVGFDLTSYTAKCQGRSLKKIDPVFSITELSGIAVNPSTRNVSWSLDTGTWPVGDISYDLQMTSPGGIVSYPIEGVITLKEAVTR
jgi:hypothetical protein